VQKLLLKCTVDRRNITILKNVVIFIYLELRMEKIMNKKGNSVCRINFFMVC